MFFLQNRIERDVKLVGALGMYVIERALKDVGRALPAAGYSYFGKTISKLFLLSNSTTASDDASSSSSSSSTDGGGSVVVSPRKKDESLSSLLSPLLDIEGVVRSAIQEEEEAAAARQK